ncbi:MAG: TRAP transporter small permease subunit [Pseudomonadota bacterium]
MQGLLKLANVLDAPARFLGKVGGWMIIPLIIIIMFDVVTRKIDAFRIWMADAQLAWFNPIIFQDAEWHLHGIILLMAFGFGYLMNAHVRVDIIREMLPRRGQAWVEFWGLLLLGIPYLLVITYYGYQFVALSFAQGEGSESLTGIPARYIIKSFLLIGFALLLMSFFATLFRLIATLFGSEEDVKAAAPTLLMLHPLKGPDGIEVAGGQLEVKPEDVTPPTMNDGGR